MNSSIALNGEYDEDEEDEDSKENVEGNESILKYFLDSIF